MTSSHHQYPSASASGTVVHAPSSKSRLQILGNRLAQLLIFLLLAIAMALTGCGSEPTVSDSSRDKPRLKVTPAPGVSYVAIIGDAFSVGSRAQGTDSDAWPSMVTGMLREQGLLIKPSIAASPTSGYVHHGPSSEFFFDLTKRVVGRNQQLVIISGSARDTTMLPDQAKLALWVGNTLDAAKRAAPKARILVIGPAVLHYEPPLEVLQVRDIVRAQAEARGALFVDPIADRWFADSPEMVRAQGDRPSTAGHEFIAAKVAPVIAGELRASAP